MDPNPLRGGLTLPSNFLPNPSTTPSALTPSTSATPTTPATPTTSLQPSTPASTSAEVTNTPAPADRADSTPWNRMGDNAHHAVIASIIIGVIIALCAGYWVRRHWQRRALMPSNGMQPGTLPLYNLQAGPDAAGPTVRRQGEAPGNPVGSGRGGDAPPPSYEEVVAPHLRVATGPPRLVVGGETEDGVVADGKTPLSEIPFEDVALEPSTSTSSTSSANQAFEAMHHNGVGDTRGHTNS